MKFFIDTADIAEIRALAETGMVDGVTTNPTLVAKAGGNFLDSIREICTIIEGPVSAEVAAATAEAMIDEGRTLAKIAQNVAVKVPLTWDGLRACRTLSELGIMVNVTLCFSANQALLAAKAGATFVSPFIGRLDDVGHDGVALIREIKQIYSNYSELSTEILAACARHPQHVTQCALAGADIVTLPPAVLRQLASHPLTDKGLAQFLADWEKTGQKIV